MTDSRKNNQVYLQDIVEYVKKKLVHLHEEKLWKISLQVKFSS